MSEPRSFKELAEIFNQFVPAPHEISFVDCGADDGAIISRLSPSVQFYDMFQHFIEVMADATYIDEAIIEYRVRRGVNKMIFKKLPKGYDEILQDEFDGRVVVMTFFHFFYKIEKMYAKYPDLKPLTLIPAGKGSEESPN